MTAVALRGLTARKLRTALTALAIVLGVALVSGTFVLTDSVQRGFDRVFAGVYDGTDAVVRGKSLLDYSAGGRATVPEELLAEIRALPEVGAAAGQLVDFSGDTDQAKIVDERGQIVDGDGSPTFGFGIDQTQPAFNPFELVDGHFAQGPEEVVVSPWVSGSLRAWGRCSRASASICPRRAPRSRPGQSWRRSSSARP
jgi:putative ABC transport system permease protein